MAWSYRKVNWIVKRKYEAIEEEEEKEIHEFMDNLNTSRCWRHIDQVRIAHEASSANTKT